MTTRTIIFSLVLFTFITSNSFCQNKFPDKIIMNDSTTVFGKVIKYRPAFFSFFGSRTSYIKFKNQKGQKTKYKPDSIKGFYIGSKKYTTVKNFKIHPIASEYEIDFAQVILEGKLNLYLHFGSSNDGINSTYYRRYIVCDNQQNECIGVYSRSRVNRELSELLNNQEDLKQIVLNEKVNNINFYDLILEYNKRENNN